ncbi:unnamed protein product, partial [Staurois parvus]
MSIRKPELVSPLGHFPTISVLVTTQNLGFSLTFTFGGGLTSHGAPWAIGDHGAPVSLPKLKKAYEKGTRGISWCPLLTPGPWAAPEFLNGQSAPG